MNVEDLKTDVAQTLEDFMKQCERTAHLLTILNRKQKTFLDKIDTFGSDNYKAVLEYVDAERNVQCIIQTKIMEMNFELEKFCREVSAQSFDYILNDLAKLQTNNDKSPNKKAEIENTQCPIQEISKSDENKKIATSSNTHKPLNNESEIEEKMNDKSKSKTPNESDDIIQKVLLHNETQRKRNTVVNRTPDLSYKQSKEEDVKVITGYVRSGKGKKKHYKFDEAIRDVLASRPIIQQPNTPEINSICAISYAESPSRFYIAVGNNPFQKLHVLNEEIHEKYDCTKSEFKSKKEAYMSIRSFCVAYSTEYKAWYRAVVIDFKMKEQVDDVAVKFVDYGNIECVSYHNLRTISENLCQLPVVAQECHLAYLYPKNWTKDDTDIKWNENVNTAFKGMIGGNLFILSFVLKEKDSLAVDLLALNSHDGETIGSYLIKKDFAREIIEEQQVQVKNPSMVAQIINAQGQSGIKEDMTDEEALDIYFENTKMVEPSNINEAVTNYSARDEERICKFMLSLGYCPRKVCAYEHTPFAKDLITTDKESVYDSALNELSLPNEGEEINLIITSIKNACQFYAIREGKPDEPEKKTFKYLLGLMNHKETIKTYKPLAITPSIGQIVLVYYDCKWLRGKVIDYISTEHDAFKLFLVDHGEEIEAKLSNMREIIKDFLELPFQAIDCYLSNICLNEHSNLTDGRTYFESRYLCEKLKARVVSSNLTSLEVVLYDADNEEVNSKMISEGFAVVREWSFKTKSSLILVD